MTTQELIDQATSLPVDERARVADALLKSLNGPESEVDAKWAALTRHRLDELRSGVVSAVPGKVVFEKIWKRTPKCDM